MLSITVVLPFYQAAGTLDRAIKSIVNQTYQYWELILVNNNSEDKGVAIAENWCRLESRIKLIHETKQGIAYALNKGIHFATGDLIARMDADDVALPQRFEKQVRLLELYPEIEVASCLCSYKSSLPRSDGYRFFVDWQNAIVAPEAHYINRFIESPLAHPTVLFYKNLIERFGGYSTDAIPEDYELWLRWMEQGVKFAKVPEPLLVWEDSTGRLSRSHVNYSSEAFLKVKCAYLSRWIKQHVDPSAKVVVCGTSKECQQRMAILEQFGVGIDAVTDVRKRNTPGKRFIEPQQLFEGDKKFLINFINKRGVGDAIRTFLNENGCREGVDFILAG